MVYDNSHIRSHITSRLRGFTMVEALIAITLVGIGITSTVVALTKLNAFASTSRNATGAYAVAMNQIDAIQSATPFNPQSGQIPSILVVGDRADDVTIYQENPSQTTAIVPGICTTSVHDATSGGVTMYRATVTVSWQYLGRGPIWSSARNRWEYQLSMSTLRASDQ